MNPLLEYWQQVWTLLIGYCPCEFCEMRREKDELALLVRVIGKETPMFEELQGLDAEQRVTELQRQAAEDYADHQRKIAERNEYRDLLRGKDN